LLDNPAWHEAAGFIREHFISIPPEVKGLDSKEQFYAWALQSAVASELVGKPDRMLKDLEGK
jgi:hypothetical protein